MGSILLVSAACAASIFDKPELRVTPAPGEPKQVALPPGVRVVDYDVSPAGPVAALLVLNPSGTREVLLWDVAADRPSKAWEPPAGFQPRSLAWHPEGNAFFVAGPQGQQFDIVKVEKSGAGWRGRQIYTSRREIRRLVPGPRPFLVPGPGGQQDVQAYRLVFGLRLSAGGYSMRSITEDGKREYQVVGPADGITKFANEEAGPSDLTAPSALPVGFHPAGHLLLWEDGKGCFHTAAYGRDHWAKTSRLLKGDLCGGTVGTTPNGAGILRWVQGAAGVDVLLPPRAPRKEASGYQLVSPPSSVPDGRGIVGITRTASGFAVNYIPIQVPLADVANAWMFLESPADSDLLSRNGGLFRDLCELDQLYPVYDSELYSCGGLDESTPTRPYLVTTDSFWELFAAAYQGMFIVRERQAAIPAFWDFIEKAGAAMRQANRQSPWAGVFAALSAFRTRPDSNPEAQRIARAEGRQVSSVTGSDFDYGELKPRGHYAATASASSISRRSAISRASRR